MHVLRMVQRIRRACAIMMRADCTVQEYDRSCAVGGLFGFDKGLGRVGSSCAASVLGPRFGG